MERAGKIIRRSIFLLLKDFNYYTTNPVILMLPFSASVLLSGSLYQYWSSNIQASSRFRSSDDLNLSRVGFILIFSLPFAVSSLVLAKASTIQSLNHHHQPGFSLLCNSFSMSIYKSLVLTYLCNMVVIVTFNLPVVLLLSRASSFLKELFGLSSDKFLLMLVAGIVYMFFTNAVVICNLALVLAGMGDCSGFKAISKACVLRKGTNSMALLLALPINLGLSAIQVLFQYRVVRAYHLRGRVNLSMVFEGLLISYLFSLLIVLDTIAFWLLIKSWESDSEISRHTETFCIHIEVFQGDGRNCTGFQGSEELP